MQRALPLLAAATVLILSACSAGPQARLPQASVPPASLPQASLHTPGALSASPRPLAAPLTRIAFGSCADEEAPQPIWDAVLAYRPQLFVFTGDNVYGDQTQGRRVAAAQALESLRSSYALAQRVPGMAALRAQVPHLAIWDDHDYGRNDAGADFHYKHESKAMFLDFWKIAPDDARRRHEGLYHAAFYGEPGQRVQLIVLDTRWFRSPLARAVTRPPGDGPYVPDDDPAKTMLGEAQWAWLAQQLREPAQLRLVVSSIQVIAEGHHWERWGNLPRELERLKAVIAQTQAEGVVLLSGDRHLGALYRSADGWPYPIVEITSSGINKFYPNSREPGPNRLGDVYGAPNFGTVEVDWSARTVRLALRGLDGSVARETTIGLDELRASPVPKPP